MPRWRKLDMSKADGHPAAGKLTAMRMTPLTDSGVFSGSARYEIGVFRTDPRSSSRKLWWECTHGVDDASRLKKHYDIWWCPVVEFDGGGQAL